MTQPAQLEDLLDGRPPDIEVNNVKDSKGGGLRAHNYWDNDAFCAAAAEVVSRAQRAP